MARLDKTFTGIDLIRFAVRNLNSHERVQVIAFFHIIEGSVVIDALTDRLLPSILPEIGPQVPALRSAGFLRILLAAYRTVNFFVGLARFPVLRLLFTPKEREEVLKLGVEFRKKTTRSFRVRR